MKNALKKGYTTGTCAAIAAKAATKMIFEKKYIKNESIIVPAGICINVDILNSQIFDYSALCAVKKYSGDDPDITNGILIYAKVTINDKKSVININGGKGVGKVTKKGLEQPIGASAINSVPRKMISYEVLNVLNYYGWNGGADVIIFVPDGEKIAEKTFNPRIGISGGISILGTSGIVEPMSQNAIIDTIKVEMNVKKANNYKYIIISPGNYGIDFIKNNLNIDINNAIKCSNFIGEAIDYAVFSEFDGILLIGHIGKFIKLAGGIMNTHSRNADCRMEILASNAALCGVNIDIIKSIMECVTCDEVIKILDYCGIRDEVMNSVMKKIDFYIKKRCGDDTNILTGIVMFSNLYGILGKTHNANNLISYFQN